MASNSKAPAVAEDDLVDFETFQIARRGRVATVDPELASALANIPTDGSKGKILSLFADVEKDRQSTVRQKIQAAWKDAHPNGPKLSVMWTPGEAGRPQVIVKPSRG